MTTMMIKYNYPFNICEREFLKIFCSALNPNFKVVKRNTLRANVTNLHKEEKKGCTTTWMISLLKSLVLLIFGHPTIQILGIVA